MLILDSWTQKYFFQITFISVGYVKFKIMTAVKDMGLNGCCSKFTDNP